MRTGRRRHKRERMGWGFWGAAVGTEAGREQGPGRAQRWGAEAREGAGSAWGAGVGVGDEGERWLELESRCGGGVGGCREGVRRWARVGRDRDGFPPAPNRLGCLVRVSDGAAEGLSPRSGARPAPKTEGLSPRSGARPPPKTRFWAAGCVSPRVRVNISASAGPTLVLWG